MLRLLALTFAVLCSLMGGASRAWSATDPNVARLQQELANSRITSGSWKNGYKLNHAAAGMNFYLAAQGLRGIAPDPAQNQGIGPFLDLYLAKADKTTGLIYDVADLAKGKTQLSDSDDAYAGMMLLLVGDYYQTPAGKVWLRKNKTRVKQIATQVILNNQLTSGTSKGLVTVYSKVRHFENKTNYPYLSGPEVAQKQALQKSCYLMDCCECYGGLKALADMLASEKDADASRFANAATELAKGINGLYNQSTHAFYILDTDKIALPGFYPSSSIRFYPHRTAQVFPQLYNVPLGDAKTTKGHYDSAWAFLNAGKDSWWLKLPSDGSTGGFIWMILGYNAYQRNQTDIARKQLAWHASEINKGLSGANALFFYNQEVGNALRIRLALSPTPTPTSTPRPMPSFTPTPNPTATAAPTPTPVPTPQLSGLMVYQKLGAESALPQYAGIHDSSLRLVDWSAHQVSELGANWGILFARNAHFNPAGDTLVFCGIINEAHSLDIFLWKLGTDQPINLTGGRGGNETRDEDANWLDDNTIVFKRQKEIWKMDTAGNGLTKIIGDQVLERSGPCLSRDKNSIFYFTNPYNGTQEEKQKGGDVYQCSLAGEDEHALANVENLQEYYPAPWTQNKALYVRWPDSNDPSDPNNHNDQIFSLDLATKGQALLELNRDSEGRFKFNNSDPCAIGESRYILFSSTRPGSQGGYDIYVGDSVGGQVWSMEDLGLPSINTELDDEGVDYYVTGGANFTLRVTPPTPTKNSAATG